MAHVGITEVERGEWLGWVAFLVALAVLLWLVGAWIAGSAEGSQASEERHGLLSPRTSVQAPAA